MMHSISFRAKALAGYAVVILLLAGGMAFAISQLAGLTTAQVLRIREQEEQITQTERLRWSGEVIVSAGRAYLIAGVPRQRAALQQAEAEFDDGVRALADAELSDAGRVLVGDVERDAIAFRRVQKQVLAARDRAENTGELTRRFEAEMLPLHAQFARSLDRLVRHKAAITDGVYAEAQRKRASLAVLMYCMLGLLLLTGLAVAWYFARLLGRAYRQEHEANQVARTALAARDEIMGIVAHDLRNPLNAITIKAGLLRKGVEPAKVGQQAESIVNVAMRMEYLIKTMLDVTTIEAGRFSVSPAPATVEALLHDTKEMFLPLATSKQVRLEYESRDTGLVIRADRERLLQVLSNLVGNALKFTPEGGQVTLSAERDGAMVRIAVVDTGPGIPRQSLPNVFDRFWRKETPGKKGTGLGLFIAKGIVDAHGGRIWVDSDTGRGARFYFTIPLIDRLPDEVPGRNPRLEPAWRGAGFP